MNSKPTLHLTEDLAKRRQLRTVQSLQVLSITPQPALNDICDILHRTIRSDIALNVLFDGSHYNVVGSSGSDVRRYESDILTEEWPDDGIVECHHVADTDWGPAHPLVNGEFDRISSMLYASIGYDGQIVGVVGVGSRTHVGPYSATERSILHRLRRVTEAMIKAEATLSRLAAEAFRALDRIRSEGA